MWTNPFILILFLNSVCTLDITSSSEDTSIEQISIEDTDSQTTPNFFCSVADAKQPGLLGRNGIIEDKLKWILVFYYFDYFNGPDSFDIIRKAIESVRNTVPCLTFVEAQNLKHFEYYQGQKLFFRNHDGTECSSYVGYTPNSFGYHTVNLGKPCITHYVIIHEVFHALGLYHEQSREDRDEYITVLWNNIQTKWKYNYEIPKYPPLSVYNVRYNVNSIMHYWNGALAKEKGLKTFSVKENDKHAWKWSFDGLIQVTDMIKLRKIYGCKIPYYPIINPLFYL